MAPPRGAIVLADGEVPPRDLLDAAWPEWAEGVELVIAADGGGRHAAGLRVPVDIWVGDGDSIDPELLARLEADGVEIRRVAAAKDETDAELALQAVLDAGVERLVILGGLGGPRLDHALANLGLLEHPNLGTTEAILYDQHASRVSTISGPGKRVLGGRTGDLVTLIPAGADAVGVTTRDLQFPLRGETLHLGMARGVSNVRTAAMASVSLESGRLLVIETPVTVGS